MIRRLSLFNEWRNDSVFLVQFPSGHVDSHPGFPKLFPVFPIGRAGIISIFMGDCAMIDLFCAAIADIRSLFQPAAGLFLKVFAGLIAGRAGSAFNAAENDLAAGICFPAVITMDTEVMSIIKGAFMIPVREAVSPDLFGYRSRIFAEKTGNIFKGSAFVQFRFDIDTVIKGQMLLVARYIFTHKIPPSTAVRRKGNYTISV